MSPESIFYTWQKARKGTPGYSQKDVDSKKDADEAEEVEAQKEALKQPKDKDLKSIDICQMLDEFVSQSSEADEIDKWINNEQIVTNQSVSSGNGKKRRKKKKTKKEKNKKLTSNAIHDYNATLVHGTLNDESQVKNLLRHNRIQELVSNGMIGSDMALTPHLSFFEEDRRRQLQEKSQARAAVNLSDNCNIKHLEQFRKRCNCG